MCRRLSIHHRAVAFAHAVRWQSKSARRLTRTCAKSRPVTRSPAYVFPAGLKRPRRLRDSERESVETSLVRLTYQTSCQQSAFSSQPKSIFVIGKLKVERLFS